MLDCREGAAARQFPLYIECGAHRYVRPPLLGYPKNTIAVGKTAKQKSTRRRNRWAAALLPTKASQLIGSNIASAMLAVNQAFALQPDQMFSHPRPPGTRSTPFAVYSFARGEDASGADRFD